MSTLEPARVVHGRPVLLHRAPVEPCRNALRTGG
jgi:hypothetical protein